MTTPERAAEAYAEPYFDHTGYRDAFLAGVSYRDQNPSDEMLRLKNQVEIAIECLDKYRTLVISHGKSPTYRIGKHAEIALNLMVAVNTKYREQAGALSEAKEGICPVKE